MGDPREPTDPAILQALRDGVRERMGYPAAVGLPELREAVAGWVGRRFAVALDPDTQVIPTLGSKEAIYSFAQVVLDVPGGRDTVVVTEPGYPVPGRGAAFVGARVVELPLCEDRASSPRSTTSRTRSGAERRSSGSTRRTTRPERLRRSRSWNGLRRSHVSTGSSLASDEAYTELWFDEPPPSALQLDDLTNVVAFNTLSKRSSMTGFRSGFVAGDAGARRGAPPVQAECGDRAAGVRPARLGGRLGRRGARRAHAGELPAQARPAARRASPQGPPRRGRAQRPCTSGSPSRTERRPRVRGALLERGVLVTPGVVPRPVR